MTENILDTIKARVLLTDGAAYFANSFKLDELPEGFQSSEFLLEHGMLDMVVPRHELRGAISRCITYFR